MLKKSFVSREGFVYFSKKMRNNILHILQLHVSIVKGLLWLYSPRCLLLKMFKNKQKLQSLKEMMQDGPDDFLKFCIKCNTLK